MGKGSTKTQQSSKGSSKGSSRSGERPNGFGGLSTPAELRNFIKSIDEQRKEVGARLKKARDLARKALNN